MKKYVRAGVRPSDNGNYIFDYTHNKVINDEDVVIFLGDFSFKPSEIKEINARLKGHKFLVLGNHDYLNTLKRYQDLGFIDIFNVPVQFKDSYLSHEPILDCDDIHFKLLSQSLNKNGVINYHGHYHGNPNIDEKHVNCTCENLTYLPLLIGITDDKESNSKKPLIETPEFFEYLEYISRKRNITSSLLMSDYIYSMMLAFNTPYKDSTCVYGSYALYKKYGIISNFSDIDFSVIYDPSQSIGYNHLMLKRIFYAIYEQMKDINGFNLRIKKIYNTISLFLCDFIGQNGFYNQSSFDISVVEGNVYRDTDMQSFTGISTFERILNSEGIILPSNYITPHFTVNFINLIADIANLLLQIIYQNGFENKKMQQLNKLRNILKIKINSLGSINGEQLENVLIRFLIRNILLFKRLGRTKDITFMHDVTINPDIFNQIPMILRGTIEDILLSEQSEYNRIFNELMDADSKEITKVGRELLRTL